MILLNRYRRHYSIRFSSYKLLPYVGVRYKNVSLSVLLIILLASAQLLGHDTTDSVRWKHYARTGLVQAGVNTGGVGYYRLNRRTERTFRDLRLFAYELGNNSYIYWRYKSSNRFEKLSYLYNFITLTFQRNTRAGVAVRYHYNQGLGVFPITYKTGHITMELAHAYDMSDYLNDTRRTSYVKGGFYWDNDARRFSTKLELEYFYQISEIVETNLSRTQLMAELIIPIKHNWSLIIGYETEFYKASNSQAADSGYIILGWKKPLPWSL